MKSDYADIFTVTPTFIYGSCEHSDEGREN